MVNSKCTAPRHVQVRELWFIYQSDWHGKRREFVINVHRLQRISPAKPNMSLSSRLHVMNSGVWRQVDTYAGGDQIKRMHHTHQQNFRIITCIYVAVCVLFIHLELECMICKIDIGYNISAIILLLLLMSPHTHMHAAKHPSNIKHVLWGEIHVAIWRICL